MIWSKTWNWIILSGWCDIFGVLTLLVGFTTSTPRLVAAGIGLLAVGAVIDVLVYRREGQ